MNQTINRAELLANMHQGFITLTANNRLKRTLALEYANLQTSDNFIAPILKTLAEWVFEALEQLVFLGKISVDLLPDKLLTGLEQELIFSRIIEKNEVKFNALLSFEEIAKSAKSAHQLLRTHQVKLSEHNNFFENLEFHQFKIWRQQYINFCAKNNCSDEIDLLQILVNNLDYIDKNQKIQAIGFEEINPLTKKLFDKLKIPNLLSDIQNIKTERAVFDSIQQEIQASATWAKTILKNQPNAKIAILVPEFETHHDLIKNTCKSILYPEQNNLNLNNYQPLHNLSLGQPLFDFALIKTAALWLDTLYSPYLQDYQSFSILLNSPHWQVSDNELNSRAEFDWIFRKTTKPSLKLIQFLNNLADFKSDELWVSKLKSICELALSKPAKQSISEWLLNFEQILQLVGLGNFQQSPISEQLLLGLKNAFEDLLKMQFIFGAISGFEAVKILKKVLQNQTFQFRSIDSAPIQIMGVLESSGQVFDFIWFMQTTSHSLPATPIPNSILPLDMQQAYQMPKSSAEHELLYATHLINRLKNSATILIFSYSKIDNNGVSVLPSGLIENITLTNNYHNLAEFTPEISSFEEILDNVGMPLSVPYALKSAIQFFKAQAICPLMAYAEFRLGADNLPEPMEDFHPIKLGNLIHEILELLIPSKTNDIRKIVTQVIEKYAKDNNIKPKSTQLEIHRATHIITEWMEKIEKNRTDFELHQLEQFSEKTFADLSFYLRSDRIDKIGDKFLVIDYKTSSLLSKSGWTDERLTDPQLPIYAVFSDNIGGIAFGQLSVSKVDIKYLGELELLNNKKLNGILDEANWLDIKTIWRKKLTVLADEIKKGSADLIKDEKVTNSPAVGFCRIYDE